MGTGVGEAILQIPCAAVSGLGFCLYLGCINNEFKSMCDLFCSRSYLDLTCIYMQRWCKVGRMDLGAVRLGYRQTEGRFGSSPCDDVTVLLITM